MNQINNVRIEQRGDRYFIVCDDPVTPEDSITLFSSHPGSANKKLAEEFIRRFVDTRIKWI